MSLDFKDFMEDIPLIQKNDQGLVVNECYPRMPANAPNNPQFFALLNADPSVNQRNAALWAGAIPANMMNGQNPPWNKRDLAAAFWYDNGNETRRATSEEEANSIALEMMRHAGTFAELEDASEVVGYVPCIDDSCATQVTPVAT